MGSSRRIVVGISGASGAIYGIRLLTALRACKGIEIHLVITSPAHQTIKLETEWDLRYVHSLAHVVYGNEDMAAAIASGSFPTNGMVIAPCSMHSLGEIACSSPAGLLTRAADVHLKERRALILMVRETPLHAGHLRNMLRASEMGAVVLPPMPAFYHHPRTIEEIIDHSIGKVLDILSIPHNLFPRWQYASGKEPAKTKLKK
jgi:flavin prenyltransferase